MTVVKDRALAMFDLRTRRPPSAFRSLRRGEVWMVRLDPAVGHEQAKTRPALVLTADAVGLRGGELVTVVPITSHSRASIPTRVFIAPPEGGLALAGDIIVDQVRTISTRRLLRQMGIASTATVDRVCRVLRSLLGM